MQKKVKRTLGGMPQDDDGLNGTLEAHPSPQLLAPLPTHVPADRLPRAALETSSSHQMEEIILPGCEQQVILHGATPGHTYLRRRLPPSRETNAFLARGEQVFEATERTLQPHRQIGRAGERVGRLVLGRRGATAEQVHERLTKVKALGVLSSDAISSVASATEASLGVLIGAGTAALTHNLPITACIVLLM